MFGILLVRYLTKSDLYQEFSGTYQKPLVQNCLPIQNDWYVLEILLEI